MVTLPVWVVLVLLGLAALGLVPVVAFIHGFINAIHHP